VLYAAADPIDIRAVGPRFQPVTTVKGLGMVNRFIGQCVEYFKGFAGYDRPERLWTMVNAPALIRRFEACKAVTIGNSHPAHPCQESEMSINIGPPADRGAASPHHRDRRRRRGRQRHRQHDQAEIEGVDFVVANTDAQALNNSIAEQRIQLGPDITQGWARVRAPKWAGPPPRKRSTEIDRALEGVHMCFIAAGMGGGTGTGAAPVIAKAARDKGVLTVGVVTKPFLFEGTRRMRSAEAGSRSCKSTSIP
jgi:hypothetical protein